MSRNFRFAFVVTVVLVIVIAIRIGYHGSHTHTDRPLSDDPKYQRYRQACEVEASKQSAPDSAFWTNSVVRCLSHFGE